MPYVVKHRKAPPPWDEVRRQSRRRWFVPLLWADWVFERIAFHLSHWSFLEVLEYASSFSVVIAVVLYFAESGERRQQKHYQAWQVINTAQGKGGNGGRLDALQQLNADHVALVGVDVDKAFLQNLALEKAELRRATFRGADLRNARFRQAGLQDADLTFANLREADLRHSDLSGAILTDADLTGADLSNSNVQRVTFDRADLRGANLSALVDWKSIESIRLANIDGVKDAPEGFAQWAVQHGAVQMPSTEQWDAALRAADAKSK